MCQCGGVCPCALATHGPYNKMSIRVPCACFDCCVLQVKHQPPRQAWRAAVFRLVMSQHFDLAAMAAIVANCIVMAMTHADMNNTWQDFMTWANLGFTVFFTVEILLKFVALGFKAVLMVRKACACLVCTANEKSQATA